ncbi:uncharacterized [Tachysurus ichikawai]
MKIFFGCFCVSRSQRHFDPINILVEEEMEPMTAFHRAAATEPLLSYQASLLCLLFSPSRVSVVRAHRKRPGCEQQPPDPFIFLASSGNHLKICFFGIETILVPFY